MEIENIQLNDLVAFHPERDDPNFQAIISSKQEYKELASSPHELLPQAQGELFNHQRFFGRLMRHSDAGFVIDKPGTGKTCKIFTAMEYFQQNRGIIREFFVVVPNKAVKHDVKYQIICMCNTGDRYKFEGAHRVGKGPTTLPGQRSAASKKLAKYYRIYTHGEFARFIMQTYPDFDLLKESHILTRERVPVEGESQSVIRYTGIAKDILARFPNWKTAGPGKASLKGNALENYIVSKFYKHPELYRLDIPDEKLKELAEQYHRNMVTECSGGFYYIDEAHLLISTEQDSNSEKARRKKKYFNHIERLLTSVKRSKKVIVTGTPMINNPKDITPLINLIRDVNDRLPDDFDFDNASIEEVNYYFGGYITYVAPIDNKVDVHYLGEDVKYGIVDDNKIVDVGTVRVYKLNMSEFQENHYLRYYNNEAGRSFKSNSLQAGVFVYPDGSIGATGFRKYVYRPTFNREQGETDAEYRKRKRGSVRWFKIYDKDNFPRIIRNLDLIGQLSAKFYEICKAALEDNEGVIYVNIYYVDGGAIPLAICLEGLGFEVFNSASSVFQTSTNQLRPYCRADLKEDVKIRRNFPARRRVAIYSSERIFPDTVNEAGLELVNSKENVHGDYIKVFIVTPVGKVGISINNVSKVFTVVPDWNESNTIQKEYRAIRATSHANKIKSLTEQAEFSLRRELTSVEKDDIRANLDIHRLAVVTKDNKSTDIDIYSTAKQKELRIQNFFRKLMIVAVDCRINKARNRMNKFGDGSMECNYQACDYICYQDEEYDTDYSTYDIYYLGEILENIIEQIIPIIRREGYLTYQQLFEELSSIPNKHLVVAVAELINSKRIIKDRFGYSVYLQEHNGILYFVREFPRVSTEYSLSYYGDRLINLDTLPLNDVVDSLIDNLSDVIESLMNYSYTSQEFYVMLESLSLNIKANILEHSLFNIHNNRADDFDRVVAKYFHYRWYKVREPLEQINEEINKVVNKSNRGRPATRRPKKYKVGRLEEEQTLLESEQEEEVYFHVLYTEQEAQTKHGEIARTLKAEGRYRLFKPSEGRWRDMNKFELIVYNIPVQSERIEQEKIMSSKLDNEIYGRLDKSGTFWIVDKTKQVRNANGQETYRGKRCINWTKMELVPVLYELGIEPFPEFQAIEVNYAKALEKVKASIFAMKINEIVSPEEIDDWSDEQVISYYRWILMASENNHRHNKNELCKLIMDAMIEQNRVLYI